MKKLMTVLAVVVTAAVSQMAVADETGIASPKVAADEVLTLTENTEVNVPEGTTKHIELVLGGAYTITKKGAGRLELALVTNLAVRLAVDAGTLAFVPPKRFDLANAAFHLDAADTSSMTIQKRDGVEYVPEWRDADVDTRKATTESGRPDPFLCRCRVGALSVVDFGSMWLSKEKISSGTTTYVTEDVGGYGAAYEIPRQQYVKEYLYAFEDREDMANSEYRKAIPGPSVLGPNRNNAGRGTLDSRPENRAAWISQKIAGNWGGTYYENETLLPTPPMNTRPVNDGLFTVMNHYNDKTLQNLLDFSNVGRCESYGGLRLGELFLFKSVLGEGERVLLRTLLMRKWRGMTFPSISVAAGATLESSGTKVTVGALTMAEGANLSGHAGIVYSASISDQTTAKEPYPVSGTRVEVPMALPEGNVGYVFSANGTVDSIGDASIDYLSANGTITKTGRGSLGVVAVGSGVTGVSVEEGELSFDPLGHMESIVHYDASAAGGLETATEGGTTYVTKLCDLSGNGYHAVPHEGNIPVGTSRPIPRPFISATPANGHTIVDFGSFAAPANPEGYGAAMSVVSTPSKIAQVYQVFADHPDVSGYAVPAGSYASDGFVGPTVLTAPLSAPTVDTHYQMRGVGGAGKTHQLFYGNLNGDLHYSYFLINGKVSAYQDRVPAGVAVIANRLTDRVKTSKDNYLGFTAVGLTRNLSTMTGDDRKRWGLGGFRLGEVWALPRRQTDAVIAGVSKALCHKWRGDANVVRYSSVNVAKNAIFRQKDADVVTARLSGQGEIEAALTVDGNGSRAQIAIDLADDSTVNPIVCSSLALTGAGDVLVSADWAKRAAVREDFKVKIVDSTNVTGDASKWRVKSVDAKHPVSGRLTIEADGLYATIGPKRGLFLVVQ